MREQATLEFDKSFGAVLLHKLVKTYKCYSTITCKVLHWITSTLLNQPQRIKFARLAYMLVHKVVFFQTELWNKGIIWQKTNKKVNPFWRNVLFMINDNFLVVFENNVYKICLGLWQFSCLQLFLCLQLKTFFLHRKQMTYPLCYGAPLQL